MEKEYLWISKGNQESLISDFLYNILSRRLETQWNKKLGYFADIDEYIKLKEQRGRTKEDLLHFFQHTFTDFSVPWIIWKNGNLISTTDLDNKASFFLLRKFWFKVNVFYDKSNKNIKPSYVNISKWTQEWLIVRWEETTWLKSFFPWSTIWINDKSISSVYIIYNLIRKFVDISEDEEKLLKRFVNFIHLQWKWKFDFLKTSWLDIKNYHKSFYAISKFLPIDYIYNYIASWKSWFEILDYNFLENEKVSGYKQIPTSLKYFSNLIESQNDEAFSMIEYLEKNKLILKYYNQKIDFILDLEWNIPNSLEVCAMLWKWLIRYNKSSNTILIYNPSWFPPKMEFLWVWKEDRITIIRNKKKFHNKIEKFIRLMSWNVWKKALLKTIWFEWELYKQIKIPKSKEQKEFENSKKIKERKRIRRKKNKLKSFEKQNFTIDDLKVWQKLYWKILSVNNKWRIFVDIWFHCNSKYEVFVTPTRLNWKEYYMRKIVNNKEAKSFKEKEDIILYFKIIDIDRTWSSLKIRLRQI